MPPKKKKAPVIIPVRYKNLPIDPELYERLTVKFGRRHVAAGIAPALALIICEHPQAERVAITITPAGMRSTTGAAGFFCKTCGALISHEKSALTQA